MQQDEVIPRLELARIEHRNLDTAIAALIAALIEHPTGDQLQIARLKKRKLQLRDEIGWLEDHLHPDIIA